MTNNIEKLYELAEVSNLDFRLHNYFEGTTLKTKVEFSEKCNFTDTKQLKLIKLLSKSKEFWLSIEFEEVKHTEVEIWTVSVEWYAEIRFFKYSHKDFSQALAGLVCELWEDLTETQREEVRGILQ